MEGDGVRGKRGGKRRRERNEGRRAGRERRKPSSSSSPFVRAATDSWRGRCANSLLKLVNEGKFLPIDAALAFLSARRGREERKGRRRGRNEPRRAVLMYATGEIWGSTTPVPGRAKRDEGKLEQRKEKRRPRYVVFKVDAVSTLSLLRRCCCCCQTTTTALAPREPVSSFRARLRKDTIPLVKDVTRAPEVSKSPFSDHPSSRGTGTSPQCLPSPLAFPAYRTRTSKRARNGNPAMSKPRSSSFAPSPRPRLYSVPQRLPPFAGRSISFRYPTNATRFSRAPSARWRRSGNLLRSIFLICGGRRKVSDGSEQRGREQERTAPRTPPTRFSNSARTPPCLNTGMS